MEAFDADLAAQATARLRLAADLKASELRLLRPHTRMREPSPAQMLRCGLADKPKPYRPSAAKASRMHASLIAVVSNTHSMPWLEP